MNRRRVLIGGILHQLPPAAHRQLADLLTQFIVAAGEPAEQNLWSMGWTTDATGTSRAVPSSTDAPLRAAELDRHGHRRGSAGPHAN